MAATAICGRDGFHSAHNAANSAVKTWGDAGVRCWWILKRRSAISQSWARAFVATRSLENRCAAKVSSASCWGVKR